MVARKHRRMCSCSSLPMAPPVEKPVFADTNLGTRLAVAVPTHITVGDLKKKLGQEHSTSFPSLGEIKVHALMVKKKLQHYHLPDSMPIWNAFNGFRIAWFLFMEISLVEVMGRQAAARSHIIQDHKRKERLDEGEPFKLALDALADSDKKKVVVSCIDNLTEYREGCCRTSPGTHVDHNAVKWGSNKCTCNKGQLKARLLSGERRQRRIVENSDSEDAYDRTLEDAEMRNDFSNRATPRGSLSGKISITGIISSYFSDLDEVDSFGVTPAESKKVNNIEKLGESCMKFSRSAPNRVACCDISGSCSEKFENSLEGVKKTNMITCKMVCSKVQTMCVDSGGRKNAPIRVPINDYRTHKNDSVKLLKDKATDYMNAAQSLTDNTPGSPPSSFDLCVKNSRNLGKNEVGKRLLIAATRLGLSLDKKRSPISTFIAERGKPSIASPSSPIKSSIFDVSDGDG